MMRALLDDDEIVDPSTALRTSFAESFPDFSELRGEQLSKERSDADVSEIVAASPDRRAVARIISVRGMIKGLFHKPGERLRAVLFDLIPNELDEFSLQSANV